MKKVIFISKNSHFGIENLEQLMEEMSASRSAKEDFPPFYFKEEGTVSYCIYDLVDRNVSVEYYKLSDSYSEITLLGKSRNIREVKKIVSQAIKEAA
jgi:hypothetical protein